MKMRKTARLGYELISDPKGQLMDLFGLRHPAGGPGGIDIARSGSVLLDSGGRVLWYAVAENYRIRSTPAEVLKGVDAVLAPSGAKE